MKKILLTLSLAALALSPLSAEELTFDFKDPKGVNNVVFLLDAPLESINGTASGISGSVTLDPKKPEAIKGKIVVQADSTVVPNAMMKDHMHGEKWLDAAKHPEITFEITKVANMKREGNKGTADVTGDFTLKGVTKELTVPVTVTYLPGRLKDRGGKQDGDLLVVRSTFTIKRGDFGIQEGQNLDKVSDEVKLTLAIAGSCPRD